MSALCWPSGGRLEKKLLAFCPRATEANLPLQTVWPRLEQQPNVVPCSGLCSCGKIPTLYDSLSNYNLPPYETMASDSYNRCSTSHLTNIQLLTLFFSQDCIKHSFFVHSCKAGKWNVTFVSQLRKRRNRRNNSSLLVWQLLSGVPGKPITHPQRR